MKAVREAAKKREIKSPEDVMPFLKAYVASLLQTKNSACF
jgi:hypothetical protein